MVLAPLLLGASLSAAAAPRAAAPLDRRERALQVLDRLAYGPRPGDVARVEKIGARAWIARQLRPASIPEDPSLEARLRAYPELRMTAEQLIEAYPPPKRAAAMTDAAGRAAPLGRPGDVGRDLAAAKILRAVYSRRQLQEVLTDFWFNHFNVSAGKDADQWLVLPYERDVIRPRVFGKFRDLLGAVAHSPAMLVYLDNASSTIDPRYAPEGAQQDLADMEKAMERNSRGRRRLGLNENYARELMELHTLGVDGGYTQKDVIALARILTGWTVRRPNPKNKDKVKEVEFFFARRLHDPGDKVFLGRTYTWQGEAEGEKALDVLASSPQTAHHLALELCRRFVADDPPPALVDRVARTFLRTGGDLTATYRAIFDSPEFWSRRDFRAKVKTPLEYVVSALRASGADVRDPARVAGWVAQLGMPLYRCEPPTGWPDVAAPWVSSGALLDRLRLALALFGRNPRAPASAA
ncbi:MAG: DUF1800 domain-containing protein, partial [Elusimicrobia bacterium]|nr:DUF1800 domain-containing protein [Elusimicrobiota bacterium]